MFQDVEVPRFQENQHIKVVRFSALRTGRLYPPGNIPGTHFCQRLSRPQDHRGTGRNMSKENYNDTIGNGTRDLSACSAVPQPTAPLRAPFKWKPLPKYVACVLCFVISCLLWYYFSLKIKKNSSSVQTRVQLMFVCRSA